MIPKTLNPRRVALLAAFSITTGCLQVEPQKQVQRAHELVLQSTGQGDLYDPYEEPMTADEVSALLADGLTLEEAQRIALVHGEDLRAEFQEIGVAQSAWVQSQLLSNPSVDLLVGFPSGGGRTLFEAILSMELLELWRIPVRTAASKERLQATVLRLARRSGEVLAETRNAYRLATHQRERLQLARERVNLTGQAYEAARALQGLGAADESMTNLAHAPLLEAQLEVIAAEVGTQEAIGKLAKLLSVPESMSNIALLDPLPTQVQGDYDSESLVQAALNSRLDLQAFEREIKAMQLVLKEEDRTAWGELSAKGSFERPAVEGANIPGVGVGVTLPLFDQNQAQIARAQFELEQVKHTYSSAKVDVAQSIRHQAARVGGAARALRLHTEELLPLAERELELAQAAYSAGTKDLKGWIAAQAHLLEVRAAWLDLQLEAATALADLERVLGKRLPEVRE